MTITVSAQTARDFAEFAQIQGQVFLDLHPNGGTSARGGQTGRLGVGEQELFEWEGRDVALFFNGKSLHSLTQNDFEKLAQHLTEGANKVYALRNDE